MRKVNVYFPHFCQVHPTCREVSIQNYRNPRPRSLSFQFHLQIVEIAARNPRPRSLSFQFHLQIAKISAVVIEC